MMCWEAPLMERHAAAICSSTSRPGGAEGGGGHYLNVGFGLGIVDTAIQVRMWLCRCSLCAVMEGWQPAATGQHRRPV